MALNERIEDGLSAIMRKSAHRAWVVVAVVVALTAMSVGVLVTVEPNVETDIQSGYFATYDEQANFFRELREKVAGVNSEIVYFELREGATTADGTAVTNITQLDSLRAQEELFTYVKTEFVKRTAEMGINGSSGVDKVISHTSIPYFVKLLYKQFPYSQLAEVDTPEELQQYIEDLQEGQAPPGCFCLPQTEQENDLALQLLNAADTAGATRLYYDDTYSAAVMFIIYDPDTSHLSKKETGGLINEIIEDYRNLDVSADGPKTYDLWKDEYFDSWGVQSWIYRIDEQVGIESQIFIAAVFVFLAGTLLVLFRNVKRAAIGVLTVAIILLWTLAGMTLGDVSVGFVSMAMFPLLLGVGVDYVIHIINEFGTERAHTDSSDEAFDLIGRRGAVALMISTLTTITGFVVMISSTSPMIVEIGTATILGIASIFILSITWVPAMLQLSVRNESREVFRPSKPVADFAEFVGRKKAITITFLVVGTAFFGYWIPQTEYVIGTVEVNLPQKELWTHEEDRAHMLDMYERFQETIKAAGQETVITKARTEGGLATAAALQDMIAIHKEMAADEFVQASGGAVNSVPSILQLYATLRDGLLSAGPAVLEGVVQGGAFIPCDQFPEEFPCGLAEAQGEEYDTEFGLIADWTDNEIETAYDDMLSREEWKPLLLTFMDETYSIAWALTFVNLEIDQEATQKADTAFSGVIEDADPTATDNWYFGTLSGIKKYNDYTNTWLTISSVASLVIVGLLVLFFTHKIRAVAAVLTPMTLTFVWWLGALPIPQVDIDLAFIFMIPIAFITSLGSDYAVHLTWNLEKQGNPRFVFKTVGKAVVYSAFTTAVAFLIFTRGAIRGSYEMFQAAVIAIVLMAILTLTTIPMFYFTRKVPKGDVDFVADDDDEFEPRRVPRASTE